MKTQDHIRSVKQLRSGLLDLKTLWMSNRCLWFLTVLFRFQILCFGIYSYDKYSLTSRYTKIYRSSYFLVKNADRISVIWFSIVLDSMP